MPPFSPKPVITKKELHAFPGTFSSRRLESRPGNLPAALYVHGGLAPTRCSVVEIRPEGVVVHEQVKARGLAMIQARGNPLWVRMTGLSDLGELKRLVTILEVPDVVHPALLETPQAPQLQEYLDGLIVCVHRLGCSRDPSHLISEQAGFYLRANLLLSVDEFERQ